MAFYGYKGNVDDICFWSPYDSNYNNYYDEISSASTQSDLMQRHTQLSEYNSSPYYEDGYNSFPSLSELNCSVYSYSDPITQQEYDQNRYRSSCNYQNSSETNYYYYSTFYDDDCYSEPKLLQYESPSPTHALYFPSETIFTISYSKSAVYDTDFDEYDPTPYSGGYDPVSTYGKPLPPSDTTCYPRSTPKIDNVNSEDFRYGLVPSPYGKDEDTPKEISPSEPKPIEYEKEPKDSLENGGDKVTNGGGIVVNEKSFDTIIPIVNSQSSSDDENELKYDESERDYYGDHEKEEQVSRIPYGSGLEAIDICESIFGYWPCLEKIEQRQREKHRELCDLQNRYDPWKVAADYLFGSSVVYEYDFRHD